MGKLSSIEWTDHTFNPWWGCTKVSPGCIHCYAETWSSRYGHDIWGPKKERRVFGEKHWQGPLKWNREAFQNQQRMRVFCASMADVFEDNKGIETERQRLWRLIEETPMLDWLLLTKRPENIARFFPWKEDYPKNVWMMTSVENQEQAQKRVPVLASAPALIRGLSVEPLLDAVDLTPWLHQIQWVIVGGESGRDARPMRIEWVRRLRDQCHKAGVPFFFKQWGEWHPEINDAIPEINKISMKRIGKRVSGRVLDGREWNELPLVNNNTQ